MASLRVARPPEEVVMARHLAIAALALGCSEILGIPNDLTLVPPEAVPVHPVEPGAAALPTHEEPANALFEPAPGGVSDAADGGSGRPLDAASAAADANVPSI